MWKNEKTGLHPLLTAAAVSVTVFSAIGVGAITGLIPSTLGSAKEAAPESLSAPAEPAPSLMPRAQVEAPPAPAPKVVRKVVKKAAPAAVPATPEPRAQEPIHALPRTVAQAPAPVVEAPKPVPAGILGVVESVREVKQKAAESNGVGPIAGGIAGAVLGNAIGKGGSGTMRKVLTVAGAAGGAFAGKEIERNARATTHWEVAVRLEDGSYQTLTSDSRPFWNAGDRVRYLDGRLQPV